MKLSQTKANTIKSFHLHVESKRKKTNKNRKSTLKYREMVVARGEGVGEWDKQLKGMKRCKLPVIKRSHGDVTDSTGNFVSNTGITWYADIHMVTALMVSTTKHRTVESLGGIRETDEYRRSNIPHK